MIVSCNRDVVQDNDDDLIHMGHAIMTFYSALIDLLGRCAPEMHVSVFPAFSSPSTSISTDVSSNKALMEKVSELLFKQGAQKNVSLLLLPFQRICMCRHKTEKLKHLTVTICSKTDLLLQYSFPLIELHNIDPSLAVPCCIHTLNV